MAVKDRHTPDHGLVKSMMTSTEPPYGTFTVSSHSGSAWLVVFGVRQEMDLMDVHGMQFPRIIDNSPMLKTFQLLRAPSDCIGREFSPLM